MAFADILGQQRVIRLLRQPLIRGQLPHALLFCGMDGVGKRLTAFTLAKAVNCDAGATGDCCDRCLSCRKAASGNHPDISTIESEGPFIKIEQIRSLQRRLRFSPLEGSCRVTIIADAQNMKAEAANALLKILEEPPPGNLIILTASDTTALLPTIVSRCLCFNFQPLTAGEIGAHLQQTHAVEPERARVIAGLAGGSLSRAVTLLDEEKLARRRQLLEMVAKLHECELTELLAATKSWKGDNVDLRQDLEWLKTWLRDLLVHNLKAVDHGGLLNLDLAEQAAAVAPRFRPEDLLEMFELFSAAQEAINHNINKRLTLEALFLSLRARARGDAAGLRSSFQAFGSTLLPTAGNLSVRL